MATNQTPSKPAANPMPSSMSDNDTRIEQFRTEIDQLKLKGSNGKSERWLLIAGAVLGIAGIVLAIVGAVQVINAGGSPADQRAAMASGSMLGIVLVIAGAALFVRFSMGRYLRFWLIRLVYEGRADTDRVVDAIERASGLDTTVAGTPLVVRPPVAPPAAPANPRATPPVGPDTSPVAPQA